MKFRLIASLILFAVLVLGYLIYQANSGTQSTPTPSGDNGGIVLH